MNAQLHLKRNPNAKCRQLSPSDADIIRQQNDRYTESRIKGQRYKHTHGQYTTSETNVRAASDGKRKLPMPSNAKRTIV